MKNSTKQDVELPQNDFGNALGAGHLENQYFPWCFCIFQPSRWASSRPISAGRRSSVWIGGSGLDNWLKLENFSTLSEKNSLLTKNETFFKKDIFDLFPFGHPASRDSGGLLRSVEHGPDPQCACVQVSAFDHANQHLKISLLKKEFRLWTKFHHILPLNCTNSKNFVKRF